MAPLWSPSADRIEKSALREYLNWLEVRQGRPFPDHDALWAWSVQDLDRFWSSIVDYYEIEFSASWTQVLSADPMPRARWFGGARLNWAQHALRRGADDATALVCVQEGGGPAREITRAASHPVLVGVDGGVTLANAAEVASWGADLVVSGSAIFDGKDAPGNLAAMLSALGMSPSVQNQSIPAPTPGGLI